MEGLFCAPSHDHPVRLQQKHEEQMPLSPLNHTPPPLLFQQAQSPFLQRCKILNKAWCNLRYFKKTKKKNNTDTKTAFISFSLPIYEEIVSFPGNFRANTATTHSWRCTETWATGTLSDSKILGNHQCLKHYVWTRLHQAFPFKSNTSCATLLPPTLRSHQQQI